MSEKINIELELNTGSFIGRLSEAKQEVSSQFETIEDAPNATAAFNQGAERMMATIDLLKDKAESFGTANQESKTRIAELAEAGLGDLNASRQLYGQGSQFATALARQWFSGLPAAVRRELDAITPELNRAIRAAVKPGEDIWDANDVTRKVLSSPDVARMITTKLKSTSGNFNNVSTYLDHLVRHTLPAHTFDAYQTSRYGFTPSLGVSAEMQLIDMLPGALHSAYLNKGYQKKQLSDADAAKVLQTQQRGQLHRLISGNSAAFRAAQKVGGIISKSSNGDYQLSNNITQRQFDDQTAALWDDYVVRASGRQSSRLDFYDQNLSSEDMKRLVSRASSGSAGTVLNALTDMGRIGSADAWTDALMKKKNTKMRVLPRQELEQYEISKYKFSDLFAGDGSKATTATISEGLNTRMLGLTGKHNQHTDKVITVGQNDYDRSNPEQVKYIEQLLSGQAVSIPGTGKKYIRQNIHGTGNDTVVRMVEESAYREVADRYATWASALGLSGTNYWNNFVAADSDFGGELKNLRKHYDATGKGWSPGYDIQANLQDKNFAIVDLSRLEAGERKRYADGQAWFGKGIQPRGSAQMRLGVGGKGTAHDIGYNTLGEWAVASGLIQQGERFMLPGQYGMQDVTDMHGMQDISQIKNPFAYSNMTSNEQVNAAHTAMQRTIGLSSMSTYDDSETRSKGIGSQMMLFLKLSPKMREYQAQEYKKRMAALDTDVGIREFILGNPNDYLARQLHEGSITVNDPRIARRVAAEKESLRTRALAGEWIDFGSVYSGYNQKANKTPITAVMQTLSESRAEQIASQREKMKAKGLTRNYTDDEIAGIWGLGGVEGGAVVDFARKNENFVGVGRSPNGFGQFVYGKNYANLAEDVFRAFGIDAQGIYLSEEDMFTLGGADFDGDGVKSVYGDQALAFYETSKMQKAATAKIKAIRKVQIEQNPLPEGLTTVDSGVHGRLFTEAAQDAGQHMGLASTTNDKASMADLTDPRNRDLLVAAIQANEAYVAATAEVKANEHFITTPEMMKAQQLGKSWHKLPKAYASFFNVTGQDDAEIPDEKDIFTASNGVKINLAALRDVGIDRVNQPSIFQDSILSNLLNVNEFASSSILDPRAAALLEALDQGVGYGTVGDSGKKLMQNMRMLKVQEMTGMRGMMTEKEETAMRQLMADASNEIEVQLEKTKSEAVNLGGGRYRLANGEEVFWGEYGPKTRLAQHKAIGIDILENHLKNGITMKSLETVYGAEAAKMAEILLPDSAVAQPHMDAKSVDELLASAAQERAGHPQTEQRVAQTEQSQNQQAAQTHTANSDKPSTAISHNPLIDFFNDVYENKIVLPFRTSPNSGLQIVDEFAFHANAVEWLKNNASGQSLDRDPFKLVEEWQRYADNRQLAERGYADGQFLSDADLDEARGNYRQAPPDSPPPPSPVHPYSEQGAAGASTTKEDVKSWLDHMASTAGSHAEYQSLMEDANAVSSRWYKSFVRAESPESSYYDYEFSQLERLKNRINADRMYGSGDVFGDVRVDNALTEVEARLENNFIRATRAHLSTSGENAFDALKTSIAGTGDEFDKQLKKLNQWSDTVKQMEAELQSFEASRKQYSSASQEEIDADNEAIAQQMARIKKAKSLEKKGRKDLLAQNNDRFAEQAESFMEAMTGQIANPEQKIERTVRRHKENIAQSQAELESARNHKLISRKDYLARKKEQQNAASYADDDLKTALLEENKNKEELRLARARRQDARLRAQVNKALRGKPSTHGIYFERAEAERLQQVDQFDSLIEGVNVALAKRNKELSAYAEDSDAHKRISNEIGDLETMRNDLIQRQDLLESPAAVVDDLEAFSKSLSSFTGKSPVHSMVEDFEAVETSIESAKSAYQKFVDAMSDKQSRGEILTEEEQDRLEKGATQIDEIERSTVPIIQARKEYANAQEYKHLANLINPEMANGPSFQSDAWLATAEYRNQVVSTISQLEARDENGYTNFKDLTDEGRQYYLDSLYAVDYEKYHEDYEMRKRREYDREQDNSEDRAERLIEDSARIGYDIFDSNNNGLISNAYDRYLSGRERYRTNLSAQDEEITATEESLRNTGEGSSERREQENRLNRLRNRRDRTQRQSNRFSSGLGMVGMVTDEITQSVANVASQFGRQMFQKAIDEAKRFVREFNAAMTEIQMVTLKTDGQIASLGSTLLQTAVDMKIAVPEVTAAATNLYRQGLGDEEVQTRMEDVLKFAKVAGINAEQASKIITTAISNNLVSSSGEAMDALVALGDAAATSAEEIAKGMQKSAASAKQAGVSYEQLVTMLTIITSKTQLGGNQAGTALQTLMYRLYRVNEGEDFFDENGNRIAANQASRALSRLGVSVYDENGAPRGAYDIMVDLAKNWDGASNISQEMVLNALGAGRQRTNIATLIQGLAEDDGKLAEEYMGLASESEGITDEKYLAYLDSLDASLTNVKNSFDQLIASFDVSGTLTGFLDFVSNFIQGLAAAEESSGQLTSAIKKLGVALAAIAVTSLVIKSILNPMSMLATIPALLSAVAIGGTLLSVSHSGNELKENAPLSPQEINKRMTEDVDHYYSYRQIIEDSEKLVEKSKTEGLTQEETTQLQENLNALTTQFGLSTVKLSDAATNIETVSNTIARANKLLNDEFVQQVKGNISEAKESTVENLSSYFSPQQLAFGASNLLDVQYDPTSLKQIKSVLQEKEESKAISSIKDYSDLTSAEQDFLESLMSTYIPEDDVNWGKIVSDSSGRLLQAYRNSRTFDRLMDQFFDKGIMSDEMKTEIGIDGLSKDRVLQLLTAFNFEELVETDQEDFWLSRFLDDNINFLEGEGLNSAARKYKAVKYKTAAAMWRLAFDSINDGLIDFTSMSEEQIDTTMQPLVKSLLSSMGEESLVDAATSQFFENAYGKFNVSTSSNDDIRSAFLSEFDKMSGLFTANPDSFFANYITNKDLLPYHIVQNSNGEIIGEGLTRKEADELIRTTAGMDADQEIDMSDWVAGAAIEEMVPIYQYSYTALDGVTYTDTGNATDPNTPTVEERREDDKRNNPWYVVAGNVYKTRADANAAWIEYNSALQQARNGAKRTFNDIRFNSESGSWDDFFADISTNGNTIDSLRGIFSDNAWLLLDNEEYELNKILNSWSTSENAILWDSLISDYYKSDSWSRSLGNQMSQFSGGSKDNNDRSFFTDLLNQIVKDESFEGITNFLDYDDNGNAIGFKYEMTLFDAIYSLSKSGNARASELLKYLEETQTKEELLTNGTAVNAILGWAAQSSAFNYLAEIEDIFQLANPGKSNYQGVPLSVERLQKQLAGEKSRIQAIDEDLGIQTIDNQDIKPIEESIYDTVLVKSYPVDYERLYQKEYEKRRQEIIDERIQGHTIVYTEPSDQPGSSSNISTNHLEEALKDGVAKSLTDERKLKSQVDSFANFLVGRGIVKNNRIDMHMFNDILSSEKYGDLSTILTSVSDLADIIDSVMVKDGDSYVKDSNGKFKLVDDSELLFSRGADLWTKILDASGSYSAYWADDSSWVALNAELAELNYQEGETLSDSDYELLSHIYGESLIARMKNANLNMWDTQQSSNTITDGKFVQDDSGKYTNQSEDVQRWIAEMQSQEGYSGEQLTWDNYLKYATEHNKESRAYDALFSNQEKEYKQYLWDNYLHGISGLTARQALSGAYDMIEAVNTGSINNFLNNDQGMLSAYYSHFGSQQEYGVLAHMLNSNPVSKVDEFGNELTGEDAGYYNLNDLLTQSEDSQAFEKIDEALKAQGKSAKEALEVLEALGIEIQNVEKRYGDLTEEITANNKAWKGTAREVKNASKSMNQAIAEASRNQYYRNQFSTGDRSSEVLSAIAEQTGYDIDYIKEHSEEIASALEIAEEADRENVEAYANGLADELNAAISSGDLVLDPISVESGGVDFSNAIANITAESYANLQALASYLAEQGFTAKIVATETGDTSTKYQIVIGDFTGSSGRKGGGGGGGGGGSKSPVQKLLEEQQKEQALWEHRRKMIQYEATRYQNAGELSNYAIMLRHESDEIERQLRLRNKQLEALKKQMAATKKHSDDWYSLRDAILSTEEALAQLINDSEEIDRTIEQITQEIIQLEIDIETEVLGGIEAAIQKERDMLDGTVSMQDIILDAIRHRYEEEWELMQEDIAKKRDALNEEIALIDERLQRRKDAEDEAAKHEELAELERQYAQISMDSTRTKDQAEMREKIAEQREELAWKAAEDEAEAQKEGLQEQIDAYDEYENEYQEYLDEYLADANNFADEVNKLLAGTQEDLFSWLEQNVEQYVNSLDEQQKQMIQGWEDTYRQMKGIVLTYWDEVTEIMTSKDSFLEYMMQTDEYINASDAEKEQMRYNWGEQYDSWEAAKLVRDEAKNWDHQDGEIEGSGSAGATKVSAYYGGFNSSGEWVTGGAYTSADAARTAASRKGLTGIKVSTSGLPSKPEQYRIVSNGSVISSGYSSESEASGVISSNLQTYGNAGSLHQIRKWQSAKVEKYSRGGYVDYTGLAMVHGSSSRPEAFLSAEDTALMRSMLDAWQYVVKRPMIMSVDTPYGNSGSTFGDVSITITEATFAEDADYEEVARRVGEAFTKELSKQGFRTSVLNY